MGHGATRSYPSIQVEIQRQDRDGVVKGKSYQLSIGRRRRTLVDMLPDMATAADLCAVLASPETVSDVSGALFQALDTTDSGLVARKEVLEGVPQCAPFGVFRSQELIRMYNAVDPDKVCPPPRLCGASRCPLAAPFPEARPWEV